VSDGGGVDVAQAAQVSQRFVDRYGLTQGDFLADFLHGDLGAEELAVRYDAALAEVRAVLAAIDDVRIADAAVQAAGAAPARPPEPDAEAEPRIIAEVVVASPDGPVLLVFDERAGYGLHYRINAAALDPRALGVAAEDVESLLTELRWINQRRSLVCRIAALLSEFQRPFLRRGDSLDLKPIAQAAVARQLGEPQSSISRAIRDKYVRAPHGTYELQFLCQRKADVVARVARAHPDLSDRDLQALLRARYECEISRRTVNYHRLRAQRQQQQARG
jgi:fermentation-respiration switch protein FrsA (DUF1100 family)